VRDYTPEYESFRDDAVAVLSGSAVTLAVSGFWWKPVYAGPIALVVAVLSWQLSPRSKGGTIIAVLVLTLLAMITRWQFGYKVL
jgi:hypothetical protein